MLLVRNTEVLITLQRNLIKYCNGMRSLKYKVVILCRLEDNSSCVYLPQYFASICIPQVHPVHSEPGQNILSFSRHSNVKVKNLFKIVGSSHLEPARWLVLLV